MVEEETQGNGSGSLNAGLLDGNPFYVFVLLPSPNVSEGHGTIEAL